MAKKTWQEKRKANLELTLVSMVLMFASPMVKGARAHRTNPVMGSSWIIQASESEPTKDQKIHDLKIAISALSGMKSEIDRVLRNQKNRPCGSSKAKMSYEQTSAILERAVRNLEQVQERERLKCTEKYKCPDIKPLKNRAEWITEMVIKPKLGDEDERPLSKEISVDLCTFRRELSQTQGKMLRQIKLLQQRNIGKPSRKPKHGKSRSRRAANTPPAAHYDLSVKTIGV